MRSGSLNSTCQFHTIFHFISFSSLNCFQVMKIQFALANLKNYFWQVFCKSKPLCSSDGRIQALHSGLLCKGTGSCFSVLGCFTVQLCERSLSRTLLLASFFYLSILTEAVGPVCFNTADRKNGFFVLFFLFSFLSSDN